MAVPIMESQSSQICQQKNLQKYTLIQLLQGHRVVQELLVW